MQYSKEGSEDYFQMGCARIRLLREWIPAILLDGDLCLSRYSSQRRTSDFDFFSRSRPTSKITCFRGKQFIYHIVELPNASRRRYLDWDFGGECQGKINITWKLTLFQKKNDKIRFKSENYFILGYEQIFLSIYFARYHKFQSKFRSPEST